MIWFDLIRQTQVLRYGLNRQRNVRINGYNKELQFSILQ
jgi:hypothetical protein